MDLINFFFILFCCYFPFIYYFYHFVVELFIIFIISIANLNTAIEQFFSNHGYNLNVKLIFSCSKGQVIYDTDEKKFVLEQSRLILKIWKRNYEI